MFIIIKHTTTSKINNEISLKSIISLSTNTCSQLNMCIYYSVYDYYE